MKCKAAFTLVEMLVAAMVFAVLAMLTFQVLDRLNTTSRFYARKADASASCRQVLDTMTQDIGTLVTRGGATIVYKRGTAVTNDELRFLCFSRPMAEHPEARMTIVSYAVQNRRHPGLEKDVPMLIRGNAPVFWATNASADDYRFPVVMINRPLSFNDVLSERMIRFEITWLREDGEICSDPRGSNPADSAMAEDGAGYIWIDLDEVRGFIISVAAVDFDAQERVDSYADLQGHFSAAPVSGPPVPASKWINALSSLEPDFLRASTHVAQRTYLLNR